MIYLGYLVDIFNCVDSGRSLSAMTIESYLSKRYLGVYISEGLPMIISQVWGDFQSYSQGAPTYIVRVVSVHA